MKKRLIVFISALLFTSCTTKQLSFQKYLNQIFIEDMENNYVLSHTYLKDYKKYNLKHKDISFGNLFEDTDLYNKRIKMLDSYKDTLKGKEYLYYKIYREYLIYQKEESHHKYNYLYNICAPSSSIISSIITVLTEFRFDNKEDIYNYIKLIKSTKDYSHQIIQYLNKQYNKGYFMSNDAATNSISTIDKIINNNPLLDYFNNYKFTFKLNKDDFKDEINEGFNNYLKPSLKKIRSTLLKYKNDNNNQKGLYYLKNGKDYYNQRLKTILGTSKNVTDIEKILNMFINDKKKELLSLKYNSENKTSYVSYKEIINDLNNKIKDDFPSINNVDYEISSMSKINAQDLSAAYYMIPPLDNNVKNIIRVNENSEINSVSLFSTIAHETLPGHMYQFNYIKSLKLPEILYTTSYLGFTEGYATYAQYFAYQYLNGNNDYIKVNEEILYTLVVLCDIGIHYKGWDVNTMKSFLSEYHFTNIDSLYNQLVNTPHIFTPYYLGYISIYNMREKAKINKKNFNNQSFHKAINENGFVSIDQMESQINDYIEK